MVTAEQARPKLTNEMQVVFDVIQYIDKHKAGPQPPDLNNAGRFKSNVQALIKAVADSFETYQYERIRFFKDHGHAVAMFAAYGPASEQKQEDEDKRFITHKSGKRILKLYSIEEMYAFPQPAYLVMKVLLTIGLSLLFGMSGTGKTFATLNIALSVAHGISWMERRVKKGIVWYINTEGNTTFGRRIQAWYMEHPDLSPTSNFRVIPWSLDLRENFSDLLDTIAVLKEENEKPSLIIFDNFSMCGAGINQNLQEEVSPVLRTLNDLAQEQECHVMVIHHTNKEDDINGTMAFRNHVDTMIQLKKEDKADKHSPILFCCQKSRDDEPFSDIKTEMKQITLYVDPDTLEEITSNVVIPSEAPIKAEGLKDTTQNVLDILGDRELIHSDWQKECTETLRISPSTFDRARRELMNKNYIEKYKPSGQKVDHYKKAASSKEDLAEEYSGNND